MLPSNERLDVMLDDDTQADLWLIDERQLVVVNDPLRRSLISDSAHAVLIVTVAQTAMSRLFRFASYIATSARRSSCDDSLP